MRIQVRYGGGFAGEEVLLRDVDTSSLPPEEAARIEEALSALERGEGETEVGADMFEYRIDLQHEGDQRTLRVADVGAPDSVSTPALQELLQSLGIA